jgi:hypothetical protein
MSHYTQIMFVEYTLPPSRNKMFGGEAKREASTKKMRGTAAGA